MLVITRKIGESFIIDTGKDRIEIVLKDIRGKNARIGIVADERYEVFRKELDEEEKESSKPVSGHKCVTVDGKLFGAFLKQTLSVE